LSVEEFQTVTRLSPDNIMAHYYLALIYLKKGNLYIAQKEVERILQIRPDLDEAHRLLNDILSRQQ